MQHSLKSHFRKTFYPTTFLAVKIRPQMLQSLDVVRRGYRGQKVIVGRGVIERHRMPERRLAVGGRCRHAGRR